MKIYANKNGLLCKLIKTKFYSNQYQHILKSGKKFFKVSNQNLQANYTQLVK
jgi:hypothetical protein